MNEYPYTCKFCEHGFMTESRYLKHTCDKMRRHEEIKTPIGQTAYSFYQLWFQLKKKVAPAIESFLESKQYKPFIQFATFVKRVKITEVDLFIRMMNEKSVLPAHWTRDEMYSLYLEYLDRKITPYRQAGITVKTIEKLADAASCDISEVFNILTGPELIQLVRERKLSPWVLLKSPKFNVKFELMSQEEQGIFLKLVRLEYWKNKFVSKPEVNQYMKKLVEEMEL